MPARKVDNNLKSGSIGQKFSTQNTKVRMTLFLTELTGQRKLQIKQPILAVDLAVTAAGGRDFGGI
jgi:hypothetical protein